MKITITAMSFHELLDKNYSQTFFTKREKFFLKTAVS